MHIFICNVMVLKKRDLLKQGHVLNKDDSYLTDCEGQKLPGGNGESHGGSFVLFFEIYSRLQTRQKTWFGNRNCKTGAEAHKVGLGTSTMRTPSGKLAWQRHNIKVLTYFAKSLSSKKADDASKEMTFLDFKQTE